MSAKFFETYPQFKGLDDHSAEVAEFFLAAYPQWEAYTHVGEWRQDRYFEMVVPIPLHPDEPGIVIDSSDHDITISFSHWHGHFGRDHFTVQEACENAKNLVDRILREEVIAVMRFGDSPFPRRTTIVAPNMLETLKSEEWTLMRSWQGTYDRGSRENPTI